MKPLIAAALTRDAFAPFGEVIELQGEPIVINAGMCERFSDLATLQTDEAGRSGISLFHGQPYPLPLEIKLMERHPLGSQAFLPMHERPFLVVVAEDKGGQPGTPRPFLTNGRQGVNYHQNVWHAVLCTLEVPSLFAVVDRIGPGNNLEEHIFGQPWRVAIA